MAPQKVDAKTLAEGKHYRVCLEMDATASIGSLDQTGMQLRFGHGMVVEQDISNDI